MSSDDPTTIGGTVTDGIVDLTALLPLLGTEQIEKHVGSALDGGYLYAAAAPLSIFGSLGVVKAAVAILVSSISLPMPYLSISRKPSSKLVSILRKQQLVLGARILDNAGFRHVGSVSPLIGLDDTPQQHDSSFIKNDFSSATTAEVVQTKRYKAENRLLEALKQKHIDDLENVTIRSTTRRWNVMLLVCTVIAAGVSLVSYIPLVSAAREEANIESPWAFPIMRAVGTGLGAVCCQLVVQFRIDRLMQARLVFQILDKHISKSLGAADTMSGSPLDLEWDAARPAEESLWSLRNLIRRGQDVGGERGANKLPWDNIVQKQLDRLASNSINDPFFALAWLGLLMSIPLTAVGYVGSLTLVKTSRVDTRGPLTWLGLELALTAVRIILWAINPGFDENTGVVIELELSKDFPILTTERGVIISPESDTSGDRPRILGDTLELIPEDMFLQAITPFTGPLEKFPSLPNKVLYFTMTGGVLDWEKLCRDMIVDEARSLAQSLSLNVELFITVFDISTRTALVLHGYRGQHIKLIEAAVSYDSTMGQLEATLQETVAEQAHRQFEPHDGLDSLFQYYHFIVQKLVKPPSSPVSLERKWNLLPKSESSGQIWLADSGNQEVQPPPLQEYHCQLLSRGSEHSLKAGLIDILGERLSRALPIIDQQVRNEGHDALKDPDSESGNYELETMNRFLGSEWGFREKAIITWTCRLEEILFSRMYRYSVSMEKQLGAGGVNSIRIHFVLAQRKRLQRERDKVLERFAELESLRGQGIHRSWGGWDLPQETVLKAWTHVISNAGREELLRESDFNFDRAKDYSTRDDLVPWQFRGRWLEERLEERWGCQHEKERRFMQIHVDNIRSCGLNDYGSAYAACFSHDIEAKDVYGSLVPLDLAAETAHGESLKDRRLTTTLLISNAVVYSYPWHSTAEDCLGILRHITSPTVVMDMKVFGDEDYAFPDTRTLLCHTPGYHPYTERNRDRWWTSAQSRMCNSYTFYLTPDSIIYNAAIWDIDGNVGQETRRLACTVMVHIHTPSPLKVYLHHYREGVPALSLLWRRWTQPEDPDGCGSWSEPEEHHHRISETDIPEETFDVSQPYEFNGSYFEQGSHQLELWVELNWSTRDVYYLRNVWVDIELGTAPPPAFEVLSDRWPGEESNPEEISPNEWVELGTAPTWGDISTSEKAD